MPALDKSTMIDNRVKLEIGLNVLNSEITDYTIHKQQACLRLFQAVPIVRTHEYVTTYGTLTISISDLKTQHFTPNEDDYYFLGLCRSEYYLVGEQFQAGFDYLLAGIAGTTAPPYYSPLNWNPMDAISEATKKDFIIGDETYEYDPINQSLRITTPAEGNITIGFGFGYSGDGSTTFPWDGLPYNMLDLAGKLTAEEVLRELIVTRGSVNLTSDADLNTDVLSQRFDTLSEKNEEELNLVAMPSLLLA